MLHITGLTNSSTQETADAASSVASSGAELHSNLRGATLQSTASDCQLRLAQGRRKKRMASEVSRPDVGLVGWLPLSFLSAEV